MKNLIEPVYSALEKKQNIFPCRANRASQIGHGCLRYLVYCRTHWQEKEPPSVELLRIFQEGNLHEGAVLRELSAAGIDLIEQQRPFELPHQITGHVDAVLEEEGKGIPVEIKSMNSHLFGAAFKHGAGVYEWNEVADRFNSKPWSRKYYGQLQCYIKAKDASYGIFLVKEKASGKLAQVEVPADPDYFTKLSSRAKAVNKFVMDDELPEREPTGFFCGICPFKMVCLPDSKPEVPEIVSETWLYQLLEDREECEEPRRMFQSADQQIKDWFKTIPNTHVIVRDPESLESFELTKTKAGKATRIKIERI